MAFAYNLCIIKPNKSTYSETFIETHVKRLSGKKTVLYGGDFPLFRPGGKPLITSVSGILSYLFQKRILRKKEIHVRDKALSEYLIQEKVDIVLAEYGMVGAMVTKACKDAEVPLVIHYHGGDAHNYQTIEKYGRFYKLAFEYASAIIGVSKDMIESLKKLGAPEEKLVLNPYGVDTGLFSAVNVEGSAKNFLAVGRFVEKKSPQSTLEAFSRVAQKHADVHLWMVGEGPLLKDSKALVNRLGLNKNVTFTGVLSHGEIVSLMATTRCFVQHSVTARDGDMEGTPNTILEASASGLPVVSTRHAGIKEAVIEGVTGFLVNEHDIDAMAEKMMLIAESAQLASKLGAAGRSHILKNYSIEDRINRLDDIICRSINASPQS